MGGAFSRSKPAGRGLPQTRDFSPGRQSPPRAIACGGNGLSVCDRNAFRPRAHKEASEVIAWAKVKRASAAQRCPQATRGCAPRARRWSCRTSSSRPSHRQRRPSRGARRDQLTARERRSRPSEESGSSCRMRDGVFPLVRSSTSLQRREGTGPAQGGPGVVGVVRWSVGIWKQWVCCVVGSLVNEARA